MSVRAKSLLTIGFSSTAGWSDVICFKRYASFASLMTGNTVKAGIAASMPAGEGEDAGNRAINVTYYVCILLCYMLGGTLFQFIKNGCPRRMGSISAVVCFTLVVATETCNLIWGNDRWQVCLLAPTFGIQNCLTFGGAMATNTTIITGNMQKMSLFFYQVLMGKFSAANARAIATPFTAIASTLLAAITGAFVLIQVADMNAAWLFLPAGVVQCGLMIIHDYVFPQAVVTATPLADSGEGKQAPVAAPALGSSPVGKDPEKAPADEPAGAAKIAGA